LVFNVEVLCSSRLVNGGVLDHCPEIDEPPLSSSFTLLFQTAVDQPFSCGRKRFFFSWIRIFHLTSFPVPTPVLLFLHVVTSYFFISICLFLPFFPIGMDEILLFLSSCSSPQASLSSPPGKIRQGVFPNSPFSPPLSWTIGGNLSF